MTFGDDTSMITGENILYISPHYDDAIYSNGGLIQLLKKSRKKISILTVFTKSKWAPYVVNVDDINSLRRTENDIACERLKCNTIDLDFPDSSARGYKSHLVSRSNCRNDKIFPSVSKSLKRTIEKHNPDCIFLPLGIGNHIDHLMVQESIIKNFSINCYLYEELPYVSWYELEYISWKIEKLLNSASEELILNISPHFEQKLKLMQIYKSQTGEEELFAARWHASRINKGQFVERIWKKT